MQFPPPLPPALYQRRPFSPPAAWKWRPTFTIWRSGNGGGDIKGGVQIKASSVTGEDGHDQTFRNVTLHFQLNRRSLSCWRGLRLLALYLDRVRRWPSSCDIYQMASFTQKCSCLHFQTAQAAQILPLKWMKLDFYPEKSALKQNV